MEFTFLCEIMGCIRFANFGDSQVIIIWAKGGSSEVLGSSPLDGKYEVFDERFLFFFSFQHIYRDLNVEADNLSKLELGNMDEELKN